MLIHAVGSCEWIVLLGDECLFHPVWMTASPSEEFGASQCVFTSHVHWGDAIPAYAVTLVTL